MMEIRYTLVSVLWVISFNIIINLVVSWRIVLLYSCDFVFQWCNWLRTQHHVSLPVWNVHVSSVVTKRLYSQDISWRLVRGQRHRSLSHNCPSSQHQRLYNSCEKNYNLTHIYFSHINYYDLVFCLIIWKKDLFTLVSL